MAMMAAKDIRGGGPARTSTVKTGLPAGAAPRGAKSTARADDEIPSDEPNPRAVAGDNRPPLFDVEQLRADLTARYAKDENDLALVLADARKLPKTFTTKEDADEATELVKEARAIHRDLEKARKEENKIFATGKAAVDGFLGQKTTRAQTCMDILLDRLNAFNKAELEKARRAREEEERLAQEEAERLAREADEAAAAGKFDDALELAEQASDQHTNASEASRRPEPNAADLTRTRTEGGAMRTTRTETRVVVDDYAKLNLEALRPYLKPAVLETAVRAWAAATAHKQTMDGVRIFEEEIVSVI